VANDPTLIADLVRAGLVPELVARVADALSNVRDSPGHVRDIVRAYESGRKRKQRGNAIKSGGKQTMSAIDPASEKVEIVPDNSERHCNDSFFLSSLSEKKRRKERKEDEQAKRGTRMVEAAELSADYWQFARSEGFDDTRIAQMWREFVDYWVAVPGQRGLKLNWSATWRNRVRDVKARRGISNGAIKNGSGVDVVDAFDSLISGAKTDAGDGDGPLLDLTPTSSKTS